MSSYDVLYSRKGKRVTARPRHKAITEEIAKAITIPETFAPYEGSISPEVYFAFWKSTRLYPIICESPYNGAYSLASCVRFGPEKGIVQSWTRKE